MNIVNYTAHTATVPAQANMNTDPESIPFYVMLLHHFERRLEYVADFAERLTQFQAVTKNLEGGLYYHVDAHLDGQQFSVYDKEKNILEVRDFSYRTLMPESVWHVTATKIIRATIVDGIEHRKVWSAYIDSNHRPVWECTYNEHPRDPLHLRQGKIPTEARQLLRELHRQIEGNMRISDKDRSAMTWALGAWHMFDGQRTFTSEEQTRLWEQCSRMQHLHSANTVDEIQELFSRLDFLTMDVDGAKSLSEWACLYRKTPNPVEWPTVLRNGYTRNVACFGKIERAGY